MRAGSVLTAALLAWALFFVGCGPSGGPSGQEAGPKPLSHEDMDFDGDGEADGILIEDAGGESRLAVVLPKGSRNTVDLVRSSEGVGLVLVCDYDGDGQLDVVYVLGGVPSMHFIPKLDLKQPLEEQVVAERGAGLAVETFDKVGPNPYFVRNEGAGKFAEPVPLPKRK